MKKFKSIIIPVFIAFTNVNCNESTRFRDIDSNDDATTSNALLGGARPFYLFLMIALF